MIKLNRRGFTLVELLVAITILGIIMVIAIPQLSGLQNDNKNTKYEKYSDSVVTSAKLYTDSYAKDMFGNNTSGCYDIPYKKLEEKNLAKDIRIDDLTCDTYNGANPTTFVRVYKSQDVYLYDIAIKCVDKNNKVVYEKSLTGDICNGKRSDEAGPEVSISGISGGWTTGRDASGNPLKATVTVEDPFGLKENIKFLYAWTKDTSNLDSLSYKTHSFTNSREDAVRTLTHDIEYPQNENGIWYLVVKPGEDGIRDLNGNYYLETHVVSQAVKLDNTPPVITNLANSKNGVWTNQAVTISGTISDSHSGVKKIYYSYKADGSSPTAFGTSQITSGGVGPFNVSKKWSSNTNESVYIIGEDSVGNKTSVLSAGKVMIDNESPTCSIKLTGTSGDNGWYKSGNVTVTLNKSDAYSDIASYGLATTSSATYNSTASATQGDTAGITWYGYVKDKAGNTASCNKNFKVDTTKPGCSISKTGTAGNNGWYVSNVSLTLTPTDALSGVAQTGLGTSTSPTLGNTKTGSQGETTGITWYGRVKDNAGNISDNCNSGTIKVDKTKPTISWNTSEGPHDNSSGITVTTTCTDEISKVASHTGSSSISSPTTGTSKTHTCTDNAGNSASTTRTFKVRTYGRHSSCGVEQYKSCENSACGINQYKSCRTESCGVESYKSCPGTVCGVLEYLTCQSSSCGYATCTTSGCGYKTCQTSACGSNYYSCATYSCGSFSHTVPRGQAFNTANCPKYQLVTSTSLGDQYKCASTCAHKDCGVRSYKSCAHSNCGSKSCAHSNCGYATCAAASCGVKSYRSCEQVVCGVKEYKSCRHADCGIESYKSCRTSACGIDIYKECWHY